MLYLDYDVLVINELTSLYNANLNHHFLGVVRDLGVIVKEDWSKSLFNDSYRDYFNAGVLLMDLAAFRKYGVSWKLHQFIVASTPFFSLEDQDALNLFFKDAVEYLDLDYNYVTRRLNHELKVFLTIPVQHLMLMPFGSQCILSSYLAVKLLPIVGVIVMEQTRHGNTYGRHKSSRSC